MAKSSGNLQTVTRVGLDLAKNVFQVHAVDADGALVCARKVKRAAVMGFFAKPPPCEATMEACGSAHNWGREFAKQGREVKLVPASDVKPYVRRGKSDAIDAAAICEATARPGQRGACSHHGCATWMKHARSDGKAGEARWLGRAFGGGEGEGRDRASGMASW